MTSNQTADLYERTLIWGEPIRQPASPTSLTRPVIPDLIRFVKGGLWFLGDWILSLPIPVVHVAPDVQRMTSELRHWTGWSARQLASVLETSHTTVRAIELGRPLVSGHSGDLRRRLTDTHAVASRIFLLTERDPFLTARAIDTTPVEGISARDHLRRNEWAEAYVAALDVLRPPTVGLLVGDHPAEPGTATAPLHD